MQQNVKYPKFGQGIVMYSNTHIIGNCTIGDNVIFGANSFIVNTHIPSNSIVLGQYPDIRILEKNIVS